MSLIAGSPNWSGLRELNLDMAHGVPTSSSEQLFAAPHLRGLKSLTIYGGSQTPEVAARLGALTELRSLSLTNSTIDDETAERLANSPGLAKLRYLDLSFNRITGRGATALLTSPHLKNLAVLDFEGNQVRGLDRAALKSAQHGGLRVLNLQSNRLTATDLAAITSGPRVRELVYFAACYNPFPESGIAKLVKGFGDFAPAVLYLMGKGITTDGAKALADWPAAERIDMLHLSGNSLSVPGAKALTGCPHLQKLNHICSGAKSDAAREVLRKQFGDRADV
jgi:Leucine-rich repeat (LRR) protein